MQEQRFYVVYDGPGLVNSEMDVKQLAPALHAIGELLESSSRILNGRAFKTQVRVRGSFKTGCFGIDFTYAQSLLESFVGLFSNQYMNAAINLLTVLGFVSVSSKSLINLLLWLKGRQVKRVVDLENGRFRIEVDDEHIEVEKAVLDLFQDYEVRKAIEIVISEPLKSDGIDSFGVGETKDTVKKITKNQAPFFAVPDMPDELLGETTYETLVKVVNVAFQEENMWRLSEGGNVFYAKVEDGKFLKEVQENEKYFAKDDLFKVRIRRRQYLGEKGNVKMENSVEEVLEHRSAARQLKLPFEQ